MTLDKALTRLQYTHDRPDTISPGRWKAILLWVLSRTKHKEPIGLFVRGD